MASPQKRKSNTPPRSSRSPSPSRILTSADVEQGNILWLAPREETLDSIRKRSQHTSEPVHNLTPPGAIPDDGFFNHPILVVSRPAVMPNTIHFVHLTSFGGQKLEKRFRKGPSVAYRRNYLTMAPASDHPLLQSGDPMYQTLTLEDGESMERRGYVKISEVYSMDWRDAQPFWRGDPSLRQKTRLSAASLRLLLFAIQQIGRYTPGEQCTGTPIGLGISTGKSPRLAAAPAATKAPQGPPSRRTSDLPERNTSPSITFPQTVIPVAPKAPPLARATTSTRSHPAKKRSPTTSLPGETARVWDEERQPLLATGRNARNGGIAGEAAGEDDGFAFFRWIFMGIKSAVFGAFRCLWFVVKFAARIAFR